MKNTVKVSLRLKNWICFAGKKPVSTVAVKMDDLITFRFLNTKL